MLVFKNLAASASTDVCADYGGSLVPVSIQRLSVVCMSLHSKVPLREKSLKVM